MTTLTDIAELTISTTVWDDPLAAGGLDADSDDALVYLTPILGPTATLLLHRLARYLTGEVAAQTWTISELAAEVGLSRSYFTRIFRLSFLAPEITKSIIQGCQPRQLTAINLMRTGQFVSRWSDQRRQLGFE